MANEETIKWVLTIVLASAGAYVIYGLAKRSRVKYELPPVARAGWIETISAMTSLDAISFCLKHAKQGHYTFRLRLPLSKTVYMTGDPVLIRQILVDPRTTKPPEIYQPTESISWGVPSIFTQTDQKAWKPFRKGVAPAFSSHHVQRMNHHCEEALEKWIQNRLKGLLGQPIDIANELLCLTVDTICQTAFEYEPTRQQVQDFLHDIRLAFREFTFKQNVNPLRRYFSWLLPEVRQAHEAVQRMKALCEDILEHYRGLASPLRDTVIARIVENSHYPDDSARAADILVFLVAGHDTTAYTLVWTLSHLAKHPKEIAKLRGALVDLPLKDRPKSPSLTRVIQESFRLSSVAAMGSFRLTHNDFFYDDGSKKVCVPKDSIVFCSQILANTNETIFPDPHSFRPDRWCEATPEQRAAVAPYGLGSRDCVGQRLAQAELCTILSRLLVDYNIEIIDPGRPEYFLVYKLVGMSLRLTPAHSDK